MYLLNQYARALEAGTPLDPALKRACQTTMALAELDKKMATLELKLRRWTEPTEAPIPPQAVARLRREAMTLLHKADKLGREAAGPGEP